MFIYVWYITRNTPKKMICSFSCYVAMIQACPIIFIFFYGIRRVSEIKTKRTTDTAYHFAFSAKP